VILNTKTKKIFKLLTKISFYQQFAAAQKVPPGPDTSEPLPLATPLNTTKHFMQIAIINIYGAAENALSLVLAEEGLILKIS